jgi:hypothetical protein
MSADGRPTANGTYFLRFPRRNYYGVPLLTIYGSGGAVMKESSGICWNLNKIDRISLTEASVLLLENRINHSTLCGASELTG